MNKKVVLGAVVLAAVGVIGFKVFLLMSKPSIQIGGAAPTSPIISEMRELEDFIRSDVPFNNEQAEVISRVQAMHKIIQKSDRDSAIYTLERIEAKQKHPFLADRLRRSILALRFNKPLDNYSEAELARLFLESKRSM